MKARFLPAICIALLLGQLTACAWDKTPKHPYAEEECPVPPDYSKLENWAAHPAKHDPSDSVPLAKLKDRITDGAVDVFFLHPTTLIGTKSWNGDLNNDALNKRTDRTTIKHQASIFNAVGRVYAPRYRQMTLGGFFDQHDVASNGRAYHTAYCDLKAAFEYYLANENKGRPIMIASHSQGSAHAVHLLKDYFDGKPLQNQLVAAYIAGWATPADTFQVLRPCSNPEETGCYATWCTFEWGTAPKRPEWYKGSVVVNPVTWRTDTVPSDINEHLGTVMGSYDEVYPEVVKTQVRDGYLWATRPDIKGTAIIRSNNFHIADYNLFWLDVRENAVLRTKKYLENR